MVYKYMKTNKKPIDQHTGNAVHFPRGALKKSNDTMKNITVQNLMAVFISLAMVHALAAPAMVGIAKSKGSFRVDDSYVAGNATLFDGATVETGVTTGELSLSDTRVALDSGTRTRVYQNLLVLDQGKVQWSGPTLRTQAGLWQVVASDSGSKAIVVRKGESVVVGALAGNVKVLAGNGALLRTISTGLAFSFTQEPVAAESKDGKDSKDEQDQDKDGKKKEAAAGAAAGTAGAAAASAGLATGTVLAIGVGVVAAVAIPVAVVATRGDSPTSATTSR